MGAISVGYATTAIPDHSKTYYEFKVSGAAIQTAFTVGFGVHGFDPSNKNIHNIGAHIGNATFLGFSYNLTETNSGNVVYDPQGNWNYAATHPGAIAAPNQWGNGAIVGVLVDRTNNNAQFTLNGMTQGPPIDISGMAGKTLYPFADFWFRSGPVATINGGANGFAENTPAGYTALDGTAASHGRSPPRPSPRGCSHPRTLIHRRITVGNHRSPRYKHRHRESAHYLGGHSADNHGDRIRPLAAGLSRLAHLWHTRQGRQRLGKGEREGRRILLGASQYRPRWHSKWDVRLRWNRAGAASLDPDASLKFPLKSQAHDPCRNGHSLCIPPGTTA